MKWKLWVIRQFLHNLTVHIQFNCFQTANNYYLTCSRLKYHLSQGVDLTRRASKIRRRLISPPMAEVGPCRLTLRSTSTACLEQTTTTREADFTLVKIKRKRTNTLAIIKHHRCSWVILGSSTLRWTWCSNVATLTPIRATWAVTLCIMECSSLRASILPCKTTTCPTTKCQTTTTRAAAQWIRLWANFTIRIRTIRP